MEKKIIKNLKEFEKYEMTYERNDIVLFNSRRLKSDNEVEKERGIMSNLYSCSLPYDGKLFNSSEQLLYYIYFKKWGAKVGVNKNEVDERIEYLMSLRDGKQVKNQPRSKFFFKKIYGKVLKLLGKENGYFENWKIIYLIIKLKYRYCKEFREVLDKYKDKVLCEDSDWGDNFNGVLWDESIGKFRGVNALGRVMKRVYLERMEIMGK